MARKLIGLALAAVQGLAIASAADARWFNVIRGTRNADVLIGTDNRDLILAFAGNDQISAGGARDIVYAGRDNDTVDGGAGFDHIFGGPGDDTLMGGDGRSVIRGGDGNDNITGGPRLGSSGVPATIPSARAMVRRSSGVRTATTRSRAATDGTACTAGKVMTP
jgi:Ca2+-binding RTX toxin-like protein